MNQDSGWTPATAQLNKIIPSNQIFHASQGWEATNFWGKYEILCLEWVEFVS